MVAQKIGFTISSEPELKSTVAYLVEDNVRYKAICEKVRGYVKENTGATDTISVNIKI